MDFREQHERIAKFEVGEATALITVNKFNEGIDLPEANALVFLRATESKTVFYQQLGRGLRKVEGKKKVLVLDFVGTYERICMVKELRERVAGEEKRKSYEHPELKIVNYGIFQFNEQVLNVLDLLATIEQGYTPEVLISQLKAEAERLGRTPGRREINQSSIVGRTASPITFVRAFGSWNNALKAADLAVNLTKGYSKGDLIAQLQVEAKRLGRTPRSLDIQEASRAGRTASTNTFTVYFGSFDAALQAAGFKIDPLKDHSRENLIAQLQTEAKRLGKTPSIPNINVSSKARRTVSVQTFAKIFGSWGDALKAAGFEENVVRADRATLIAQLQAEAKRLGKNPTSIDINVASQAGRTASTTSFLRAFGSWGDVLKAAGLKIRQNYSKETLITQLKAEAKRLKRTPMAKDIIVASKAGRTASTATFRQAFGSWDEALKATGFKVVERDYSQAALIAKLQAEAKRLGRTPRIEDIDVAFREGRTVGSRSFIKVFGSWDNAIAAAQLGVVRLRHYSKDVLIAQLQGEAKRLGHTPTQPEVYAASKRRSMPSVPTFVKAFGSWSDALAAAGLKVTVVRGRTPEILIAELQAEAKRLGRTPKARDIAAASKEGRTASPSKFVHAFGSHNRALEAAGLKLNKK